MKIRPSTICIPAAIAALLIGCSSPEAGDTADAMPDTDAPRCIQRWQTEQPTGTEVKIANNLVVMTADTLERCIISDRRPSCVTTVRMTQRQLVGDFEVTATMTGFGAGTPGVFVQLYAVSLEDASKFMYVTHGSSARGDPQLGWPPGGQETCFKMDSSHCILFDDPVQPTGTLSLSRQAMT